MLKEGRENDYFYKDTVESRDCTSNKRWNTIEIDGEEHVLRIEGETEQEGQREERAIIKIIFIDI